MLNISLSKMLRSMVPLIDPSEDFFNIAAAEEQMGEVADERRKEMDAMNAKLKGVAPSLAFSPACPNSLLCQTNSTSWKPPAPLAHVHQIFRHPRPTSKPSTRLRLPRGT